MTDLKQLRTYTTQETIEGLRRRAREHSMTMSKYLEYLILKDIQSGERSKTTKGNITLAYKYERLQASFFLQSSTVRAGGCEPADGRHAVRRCVTPVSRLTPPRAKGKGASGFWIEQNGNNQPTLYMDQRYKSKEQFQLISSTLYT